MSVTRAERWSTRPTRPRASTRRNAAPAATSPGTPGADSAVGALRTGQRAASSAPATMSYGDNGQPPEPVDDLDAPRAPTCRRGTPRTTRSCARPSSRACIPERRNDQPNGTVDADHLKALLQDASTYPGTNPSRPFASFFRQWVQICSVAIADPGHLLPAGPDREEDLGRGHADRWWLQPLLDPPRVGQQLHAVEQPEARTATRRWGSTRTPLAPTRAST